MEFTREVCPDPGYKVMTYDQIFAYLSEGIDLDGVEPTKLKDNEVCVAGEIIELSEVLNVLLPDTDVCRINNIVELTFDEKLVSVGVIEGKVDQEKVDGAVRDATQAALVGFGFDGFSSEAIINRDDSPVDPVFHAECCKAFEFDVSRGLGLELCTVLDSEREIFLACSAAWKYEDKDVINAAMHDLTKRGIDPLTYTVGCKKCKMKCAICLCVVNIFLEYRDSVCRRLLYLKDSWREKVTKCSKTFKRRFDRIYSIQNFLRIYCQWIGKLMPPIEAAKGFVEQFIANKSFYRHAVSFMCNTVMLDIRRERRFEKSLQFTPNSNLETLVTGRSSCVSKYLDDDEFSCKCWNCLGYSKEIQFDDVSWLRDKVVPKKGFIRSAFGRLI